MARLCAPKNRIVVFLSTFRQKSSQDFFLIVNIVLFVSTQCKYTLFILIIKVVFVQFWVSRTVVSSSQSPNKSSKNRKQVHFGMVCNELNIRLLHGAWKSLYKSRREPWRCKSDRKKDGKMFDLLKAERLGAETENNMCVNLEKIITVRCVCCSDVSHLQFRAQTLCFLCLPMFFYSSSTEVVLLFFPYSWPPLICVDWWSKSSLRAAE